MHSEGTISCELQQVIQETHKSKVCYGVRFCPFPQYSHYFATVGGNRASIYKVLKIVLLKRVSVDNCAMSNVFMCRCRMNFREQQSLISKLRRRLQRHRCQHRMLILYSAMWIKTQKKYVVRIGCCLQLYVSEGLSS